MVIASYKLKNCSGNHNQTNKSQNSRIFHSCVDFAIAAEELQNEGLYAASNQE
jgi:hypothetical protein